MISKEGCAMRVIVKARRNTARYAAGVFRIVHFSWSRRKSIITTGITCRGKRKRRLFFLRDGVVSKDIIAKFAFEREIYGSYAN